MTIGLRTNRQPEHHTHAGQSAHASSCQRMPTTSPRSALPRERRQPGLRNAVPVALMHGRWPSAGAAAPAPWLVRAAVGQVLRSGDSDHARLRAGPPHAVLWEHPGPLLPRPAPPPSANGRPDLPQGRCNRSPASSTNSSWRCARWHSWHRIAALGGLETLLNRREAGLRRTKDRCARLLQADAQEPWKEHVSASPRSKPVTDPRPPWESRGCWHAART